jgi:hypothetical protein
MKSRSQLAACLGCLAASVLLHSRLPMLAQEGTKLQDAPRAVVAESSFEFGTLARGERLTHTFTVRNEGRGVLNILRVDLSEPGMKSRFKPAVSPGEEGRIVVEWDTTRLSGDVEAKAVVHLNDPARPNLTLVLSGAIRRSIDIHPARDLFFSLYRDETAERRLTVVNNEERPVAITAVRQEGEHFTADVTTVRPGHTYEVVVKVPSGWPAGRYPEALFIETDHPRSAQLRIGVNVFIKNDIYASPEILDFRELTLQQLRRPSAAPLLTQTTTIRKRNGDFLITGISSDIPALQIRHSPSGRSNSYQIDVSVDPERAKAGAFEGAIRLETDDRDIPVVLIPVLGVIR